MPQVERYHGRFDAGAYEVVSEFQRHQGLEPTCVVDRTTAPAIGNAVGETNSSFAGRVTSPDRARLGGLNIQIVDNLEPDVPLVDALTNEDGLYLAYFSAGILVACRLRSRSDNSDVRIAGDHLLIGQ